MKIEVELEKERETKNTYRYDAKGEGKPPEVKNVYIQKWAFEDEAPEKVKLVIEGVE